MRKLIGGSGTRPSARQVYRLEHKRYRHAAEKKRDEVVPQGYCGLRHGGHHMLDENTAMAGRQTACGTRPHDPIVTKGATRRFSLCCAAIKLPIDPVVALVNLC
jgi:hypothetical protein